MKTLKIQVYEYQDLLLPENSAVLDNVLEKLYNINVDYEDWYCIEDYNTIGETIGINNFTLMFSGFHSQGDGACFTGNYQYNKGALKEIKKEFPMDIELHNIVQRLQELQKLNFYNLLATIKHNSRYYHEESMIYYIERNDNKDYFKGEDLEDIFCDLAKWMYNSLHNSYNELTSKEAILETIEANDYNFDGAGNLI